MQSADHADAIFFELPASVTLLAPTTQTITLTNNSSSALSGLKLLFGESDSLLFYSSSGGEYNGVRSFTEQDKCRQQGSITLNSGAIGTITVFFSPQESCPWLPQGASLDGLAPAKCPLPLTASLTASVPSGPSRRRRFASFRAGYWHRLELGCPVRPRDRFWVGSVGRGE